jgi:hypothetical protein
VALSKLEAALNKVSLALRLVKHGNISPENCGVLGIFRKNNFHFVTGNAKIALLRSNGFSISARAPSEASSHPSKHSRKFQRPYDAARQSHPCVTRPFDISLQDLEKNA